MDNLVSFVSDFIVNNCYRRETPDMIAVQAFTLMSTPGKEFTADLVLRNVNLKKSFETCTNFPYELLSHSMTTFSPSTHLARREKILTGSAAELYIDPVLYCCGDIDVMHQHCKCIGVPETGCVTKIFNDTRIVNFRSRTVCVQNPTRY